MNDHEKDNEYEEFLRLFEKSHSSGSDETQEDTPAIHRKQPLQEPRRSTRQMPPRTGSTSRQNSAPLPEYPVRRTQPTRKPGMYLSPKRKAAKKRRQRRLTIISVILAAVMILSIILIVKSCSGSGDALKGTWDLDGVTVYQFDGNGHGSLNLPSNTYPFTYEIKDNELHIDFESDAARDADYTFSVKNGVLTMTGGEGSVEPGRVYELTRQE